MKCYMTGVNYVQERSHEQGKHGKIASGVAERGDSGVAGEGRVDAIPKFHSWGKCTMPLRNINSDRMSNASSGLCIILVILYYISYKQSNRTPMIA